MQPDPREKPTLTVEEAGEVLGISRTFAYRMARDGELPIIKLGHRMIVPTEALLRWMRDTQPARSA